MSLTIALEEVGTLNLIVQFVSRRDGVYNMQKKIFPGVRTSTQMTSGPYLSLVFISRKIQNP